MSKTRPPIPSDLQRRVRQRCGFGCIICGCPIYDYDHIEEYAVVMKHEYENLVLLCPTCHRKKTKCILSIDHIRRALDKINERERTGTDELPPEDYKLNIGNNIVYSFQHDGYPFIIEGFCEIFIKFSQYPKISAVFLDANNNEAIRITDNVYSLCSKTWDIEYVGNTITFRNGLGSIFTNIKFDVPNHLIKINCKVKLYNGTTINITDNGIFADNILLAADNEVSKTSFGLIITYENLNAGIIQGGMVYNCSFSNSTNVAILNTIKGLKNRIDRCDAAFVWTVPFLDNLKNLC